MKAVLISIQPKYCELIASGRKTVEVRKTKPKIDVPFKCYIYCTIAIKKVNTLWSSKLRGKYYYIDDRSHNLFDEILNGKVIGEFICDRISETNIPNYNDEEINTVTQLRYGELKKYANGKTVFLWHISDLKIYDKPKELGEFKTPPCEKNENHCSNCGYKYRLNYEYSEYDCDRENGKTITRPPQSWRHVEERQ